MPRLGDRPYHPRLRMQPRAHQAAAQERAKWAP